MDLLVALDLPAAKDRSGTLVAKVIKDIREA